MRIIKERCFYCNKIFEYNLKIRSNKKDNICKECKEKCKGKLKYRCNKCNKVFRSQKGYEIHIGKVKCEGYI